MRVPRGRPATVLLVLSLLLVLGLVVEGEMGHSGVVPGLGGVTWSDLFQDTYQEAYESYVSSLDLHLGPRMMCEMDAHVVVVSVGYCT
jgi:hypothetical protein